MHEVMEPYGYVSRREYDEQREERLPPEFLQDEEEYTLRYIQMNNPKPFYATDYIICLKGVYRRGRLPEMFSKFREVHFKPVSPDRLPATNVIGHLILGKDGLIYSPNLVQTPERGYFLGGPEDIYPPDLEAENHHPARDDLSRL